MDEDKPAYKLRKEDLKPFVNISRYFDRCFYAGQTPEPGENLEQFVKTYSRSLLLGLYNLAVAGGAGAIGFGIVKGLEKII